jgi:maleamate amidohydrolase
MALSGSESAAPATALILVDVINSFFVVGMPNHYSGAAEVLDPLRRLLAAARAGGRIVVHAVERHYPGFDDHEWRKLPRHHLIGDPDAAFVDGFTPEGPREIVCAKRRYSAFFATDLALFLREQKIERVVIAGVKTNVCIRATAQDAFANGFDVIVPREATNSNRPHLAAASLEDIERYFGAVVSLDRALEMLT